MKIIGKYGSLNKLKEKKKPLMVLRERVPKSGGQDVGIGSNP